MNISALFIQRPIATTLLMVALFFAGLMAYKQLPVAALPEVDYPTIQVTTYYPGASPDAMAALVTSPLEKQLGQASGLSQMTSSSAAGVSIINLKFSLDLDMSVAEQETMAAVDAAANLLPSDLPTPPVYNKVNPADTPVLTLAVTSSTVPLYEVRDMVELRILQKISQVSGVGLVSIAGGQKPAVRIRANPAALAYNGLTLNDLRTAVEAANVNQPTGSLNGPRRATTLNTDSQLKTPKSYNDLIIKYNNDAPLRLSQVAQTVNDAEDVWQSAWVNKSPAILLNIQRQPGANVIEVVNQIKALLPELQTALPSNVELSVVADRTDSIRQSIDHIQSEMLLSILLVVVVTFVFLRSLRATFIPAVVVPLSIVGTFGIMYFLGYSLNNLSLMALTIATGFVVDDAIVMIENIARHIEDGQSPLQAALKGAKEIGFTLISLTISLIAVLIPLLFMQDVLGRLFRQFAVTLTVAILFSLVISLVLTPMMCSRMLKDESEQKENRLQQALTRFLDKLMHWYSVGLDWVFKRQFLTLMIAIATFAVTALLYLAIPKGFFPQQDTGMLQLVSEASQSVSFDRMRQLQRQAIEVILKDPAVVSVTTFIGVDQNNQRLNTGRLQVVLKPHEDRDSANVVLKRLQKAIEPIQGVEIYGQPIQDLSVDTGVSHSQYQLTLSSLNSNVLAQWVEPFTQRLRQIPGVIDVSNTHQASALEAKVDVDRDLAARYGITMSQVDEALYDAYGQRLISTIYTESAQYRVVLEVDPAYSQSIENLQSIYVQGTDGLVKLTDIAKIVVGHTYLEKERVDQFPSTQVSFNLEDGYALSDVVDQIRKAGPDIGMSDQVEMRLQGALSAYESSLSNSLWLMLAAIFIMYIVLGVLYENFIHPITILSTLPSAAIGALVALMLAGKSLDMVGIIGIILLIGIVKKNAIMMIDFALVAEREEGLSPLEAMRKACLLRFRPILMTTLAALFGAIPLMFSSGMGAELRQPLGLAIVGGLICSQMLTLFTTPIIYLYFERLATKYRRYLSPQVKE